MYFLYGPETFLRGQAARTITELCLKDAPARDFNEAEFMLGRIDIQAALSVADQLPMMAERRLVRISDLNKLPADDEDLLAAYLDRPAKTAVVILSADEFDKRRKIFKTLEQKAVAVEFAEVDLGEAINWARARFKELGARVADADVRLLVELSGSGIQLLANEVEKLYTASLPDKVISSELVQTLTANSREISNFDLTDNLLAKNRSAALKVLHKLLSDGAEPVMLVGLIASNFHKLIIAKDMMQRGAPPPEVSKAVAMPPSKLGKFLETARRVDMAVLTRAIRRLAEVDLAIKTSVATPEMQIEMLVCELAA